MNQIITVLGFLVVATAVVNVLLGFRGWLAARRAESAKPSGSSMEQIIRDYGAFMERHPPLPTRIEDTSVLPHQKAIILDALLSAMEQQNTAQTQEFISIAAMSLVQFQDNVGREPLEQLGMDISKFPSSNDLNVLREQIKLTVEAQRKTEERFNAFNKLVQNDLQFVTAKIAAADALRRR